MRRDEGMPTFVRRDAYTGPRALIRLNETAVVRHLLRRTPLSLSHGSREHYYHFLLGYLLPLVAAQRRHRFEKFLALDCGPLMTPILAETLSRLGHRFEIVRPDAIGRPISLETWDYRCSGRRAGESLRAAVELVREAWREHRCPGHPCTQAENILIRRSEPHPFYLDGRAERPGYGTSRRGISNLEEVSDFLGRNGVAHAVYEPGAHCLGCQVRVFGAAKRLLGFRGAEWANLIWANPGTRVRMLDATPPADLIAQLMKNGGISHEFVVAPSPHAPENPEAALRFFADDRRSQL